MQLKEEQATKRALIEAHELQEHEEKRAKAEAKKKEAKEKEIENKQKEEAIMKIVKRLQKL